MEKIRDVEQMPVYPAASKLALDVETQTRDFGPDFRWLRIQCLRSSESVCANMAEGFYSQYSTEYLQALHRCRREARETIAHIRYGLGVKQLDHVVGTGLISEYEDALVQLANLMASIERKMGQYGKTKSNPSTVREVEEEYVIGSQNTNSD